MNTPLEPKRLIIAGKGTELDGEITPKIGISHIRNSLHVPHCRACLDFWTELHVSSDAQTV